MSYSTGRNTTLTASIVGLLPEETPVLHKLIIGGALLWSACSPCTPTRCADGSYFRMTIHDANGQLAEGATAIATADGETVEARPCRHSLPNETECTLAFDRVPGNGSTASEGSPWESNATLRMHVVVTSTDTATTEFDVELRTGDCGNLAIETWDVVLGGEASRQTRAPSCQE